MVTVDEAFKMGLLLQHLISSGTWILFVDFCSSIKAIALILLHNKLSQQSLSKFNPRRITDYLPDRKKNVPLRKLLSKPSALQHHMAVCSLLHSSPSIPMAAPLAILQSHHWVFPQLIFHRLVCCLLSQGNSDCSGLFGQPGRSLASPCRLSWTCTNPGQEESRKGHC